MNKKGLSHLDSPFLMTLFFDYTMKNYREILYPKLIFQLRLFIL